jgi:hypothetical protein
MKIREIVCKRWLLSKRFVGITIYPFIFYAKEPSLRLRRHEWAHIGQVRRLGWLRFYFLYIVYSIRFGYRDNPLEVEARDVEMYSEKWNFNP